MEYVTSALSAVYAFFTPGPTTPIFQEGGALHAYNEDVCQILAAMAVFAILDVAFVKPFIVPKARYFALHAICNGLVCYFGFSSALAMFTEDTRTVFRGPGAMITNNIVAALHFYHCAAFKLSADDIFHHMTFVLTLCSMAIPVKQVAGHSMTASGFFLSGLPGGIDYVLLTLSAHGIVTKDFQKDVYTKINVWMRAPSMSIFVFIWWQHYVGGGGHEIPLLITIISQPLHYYNGQFYGQQAIESNAIYKYKKKLEKMGIAIPDMKPAAKKKDDAKKAPSTAPVAAAATSKSADAVVVSKPSAAPTSRKSAVTLDAVPTGGSFSSEGLTSTSTAADSGDSSVTSPLSGAHVPSVAY